MKHDAAVVGRLTALAAQHDLPESVVPRFLALLELLASDRTSITSVRDPRAAVSRHIEDSLTGLLVPELRSASRLADLGSGAGLPGLVLAIALPQTQVALIESVARKCRFQSEAAAATGCENVTVVPSRAESWRDGLETQDVVTARALAPLPVLVEYAAPLLAEGGVLVAWKGTPPAAELDAGDRAAALTGLAPAQRLALPPFEETGAERALYRYLKVKPTPDRFPRREGMARKRPLAG